ncbi:hypothetical protein BJY00DRAFT_308190 [Aspergillus carlsbadensis]|nr:hypothetical protein BJY00DRAFT_308190 [Aspergillus carlsbadensis]
MLTCLELMALYKEVQEYYDGGLHIPDDVTLLFSDDNFGSVRRLPSDAENERRGGAGIYYHLDNSCARVWQQLEHTYNQGADQVWIFNVGDIKPLEIPLTFVFTLAWNIEALEVDQLPCFFNTFFERHLSLSQAASKRCAGLLLKHDRLVSLRKHEHIEGGTFSLINYNEAENIIQQWKEALEEAEELQKWIPSTAIPSYFQLVLHPIKASYIYIALRVNQTKNQLYGVQRRNTANSAAYEVLRLFEEDFNLSVEYHSLLDGKWNHIMRQPHYGYTETWHAPSRDLISGLSFVQTRQDSNPISGWIGVAVEGHQGVRPGLTDEESDRTIQVAATSSEGRAVAWTVTSPRAWLSTSPSRGTIEPKGIDKLVKVSVDWENVPAGFNDELLLDLHSSLGDYEQIHVRVKNNVPDGNTSGFVEADGHVSINATSFKNLLPVGYRHLPFVGRTSNGAVALAPDTTPTHSEFLHYPYITFTSVPAATLVLEFTLTLDTNPDVPITYDIQYESVMDNVWKRRHQLNLGTPRSDTLDIRLNTQNCVLEKIVLDLGGLRESYLDPPESAFYSGCRKPLPE